MSTTPTLYSLCVKAVTTAMIHGHVHEQDIIELPPHILDGLMQNFPPLALQNMHELLERSAHGFEGLGYANASVERGRKRGRYEDLNTIWKILYMKRWQDDCEEYKLMNQSFDWQQLYWEKHLQGCLDEAAETALLPSFNGYIGDIVISEIIMSAIGHWGDTTCTCMQLSFHCHRFGKYMRCLRLQNVLCAAETCELLGDCNLQRLAFRSIISKSQINGVCMHLNQHRRTLSSLEFIHCRIPLAAVDQIFGSVYTDVSGSHQIQELYIKASPLFDSKSSLLPTCILSFLSSARDLQALCICDSKLQPKYGKMIIDVLLHSSSSVVTLEMSENNLAGWLSKVDRKPFMFSSLIEMDNPLKSLRVLTLRGNNLHKEDAEDLQYILVHMPSLRSFDISDNAIMDDGVRSLIPYFVWALAKDYPLSDIKLNNCNLSCKGVADLLTSLPTLKEPLKTFCVAENDLGSNIAEPLAKFLASSGIKELNIEDVGLGTLGFQQFEDQIPKETALQYINISKNRGGIRTAYFISKVLICAPDIAYIHAGGNIMPPESAEIIHGVLKESRGKLKVLDLTGNTQLSQSSYISRLLDFVPTPVVISPPLVSGTPYDDDP